MWDRLAEVIHIARLGTKAVPQLSREAFDNFKKLQEGSVKAKASDESTKKVRDFYQDLWRNPTLQSKREAWSRQKHKPISSGPPGGADIVILAVALDQTSSDIQLLTMDSDFTIFFEEIKAKLGIEVIDASTL